jgi:hypothetical protein
VPLSIRSLPPAWRRLVPHDIPRTPNEMVDVWQHVMGSVLTLVWSRLEPPIEVPPPSGLAPSDNMQRSMNLIMPLRWGNVVSRAELARGLSDATDMVLSGLNNIGTVHFARFVLIDRYLCMFSIYDGDPGGYIRDFIAAIGPAFDMLMGFVEDPPPPVQRDPDAFLAWVAAHDAFQFPSNLTDLAPTLTSLERRTLVQLHRHPHVQLGLYRNYPGFSASQIREALEVGW